MSDKDIAYSSIVGLSETYNQQNFPHQIREVADTNILYNKHKCTKELE